VAIVNNIDIQQSTANWHYCCRYFYSGWPLSSPYQIPWLSGISNRDINIY